MTRIETNRLIIRKFSLDDVTDFYEYAKVEGVGEQAGWKHHTSISESSIILQEFVNEEFEFAVVLKANNKVIGSIGLHEVKNDNNLKQKEIGYVISKDYWHQGIGSEATQAVIRYCFEELKLDLLWCCHFDYNEASKRLILKNGFRYQKTFEKDIEALDYKRHVVLAYTLDKKRYQYLYNGIIESNQILIKKDNNAFNVFLKKDNVWSGCFKVSEDKRIVIEDKFIDDINEKVLNDIWILFINSLVNNQQKDIIIKPSNEAKTIDIIKYLGFKNCSDNQDWYCLSSVDKNDKF